MSRKEYKHHTTEIVDPANWPEILMTAIGVISIVVVVNFLLVLIPSTNTGYLLLKNKWHVLQRMEEDVDLLVLGDSSCLQGVLPDVAAEILGLKDGLNLCTTIEALAVNDAWMLESYLARFSPPKAAIVVHVYDFWWGEPSAPIVAQIPLEWGYWRRLRPRLDLNAKELVQVFAARYVPLYANERSVRWFVEHPFRAVRAYREFTEALDPNGFRSQVKAAPRGVREDKRRHIEFVRKNAFRMSEANRKALERIGVMAEEHDFPVYLVNAPTYAGLVLSEAFRSYFNEVSADLREFAAGSAKLHYVPDVITFNEEMMQDVDHVILPAAERYTRAVFSRIVEDSRWRSEHRAPRDPRGPRQ